MRNAKCQAKRNHLKELASYNIRSMDVSMLTPCDDGVLESMARETINGKNFKTVDGWVVYVYHLKPNPLKRRYVDIDEDRDQAEHKHTYVPIFYSQWFRPDSHELAELYNAWKREIYRNVRTYVQNKKEAFASTLSSDPPKQWGETYGYTLADPYTLSEIEAYERHIVEGRLPEDFREYVLNVSREFVYKSSYPRICTLYESCDMLRMTEGALSLYVIIKGSQKGTIRYSDGRQETTYFHDLIKEAN